MSNEKTIEKTKPQKIVRKDYLKKVKKAPKKAWIWEDYILEQTVNILSAPESVGKSMLAVNLAVQMVNSKRGGTFLNKHVKHQRVLYISNEMPDTFIEERLKACGIKNKTEISYYCMESNKLSDIEKELDNIDFVIIDIVINMVVDNEVDSNSYPEISNFYTKLRILAVEKNCTFLLIHHLNKNGSPMGSKGFVTAADSRFQMVKKAVTFDEEGNASIQCTTEIYGKGIVRKKIDTSFKYPFFELRALEENDDISEDKIVTKIIESVVSNSQNEKAEDIVGTYPEVATKLGVVGRYQCNPRKLGKILKTNESDLNKNGIFFKKIGHTKIGDKIKIWYESPMEDEEEKEGFCTVGASKSEEAVLQ